MLIPLAAAAAMSLTSLGADITNITSCIAYAGSTADARGEPLPDTLPAMVSELEMLAAMEGVPDRDAKMLVAVALVGMNAKIKDEGGLEFLDGQWSAKCSALADRLTGG